MTENAHPKYDERSEAGEPGAETVYFDATLQPHRSLSPRGFLVLMTAIAGTGFLIGFAFFLAGAWPVAGFCGLEILLVYLAFKLNYRDGRRAERLRLSHPGGLSVSRIDPDGHMETRRIEPTWLQVDLVRPKGRGSQLRLRSHGRSLVVGSFLTGRERADLAKALRAALERYRAPATAGFAGPAVEDG